MSEYGTVTAGLRTAYLFATGRPEALALLPPDMAGTARSFWSAALCFPAFLVLRMMAWSQTGEPPSPAHALALDGLFFVIGWIGYVLLSRPIAATLGGEARWGRYVAAWNWANLAQYAMLLVAAIPGLLGAPEWLDQALQLVALGWALWLEWFVGRVALGVGGAAAAGLVAIDVCLGLALAALNASFIWG